MKLVVEWYEQTLYRQTIDLPEGYDKARSLDQQDNETYDEVWCQLDSERSERIKGSCEITDASLRE